MSTSPQTAPATLKCLISGGVKIGRGLETLEESTKWGGGVGIRENVLKSMIVQL